MSPTTKFSKFLWEAPLSLLEPRPQVYWVTGATNAPGSTPPKGLKGDA